MLELRALSTLDRPATVAMERPVPTPIGSFAPLPYQPPAGIVLAVHPLEPPELSLPGAAACRSYMSEGLVAPDRILGPLGWLVDVRA